MKGGGTMKSRLLIFLIVGLLSTLLGAKEITFWFAGGDPNLDLPVVRRQVEEFEKETGIQVKLVVVPWAEDPHTKLQVAIMSGKAPDLVKLGSPFEHVLARFGVLEPLDNLISKELKEQLLHTLLDASQYKSLTPRDMTGKLISIPYFTDTRAILYRKDIFEERGVPEPIGWTWNDFVSYAKELTFDRNGDGKIDVYGFGTAANYTYQSIIFAWQAGGQLIGSDDRPGFTTEQFYEGIRFYADLFSVHKVVQPGAINVNLWDVRRQLAEGQLAMYIDAGDSAKELQKILGDNLGVGLLPMNENTGRFTSYFGSDAFVVPKQSRNKVEAVKLLEWMMNKDRVSEYCTAAGFLPSRIDSAAMPHFSENPIVSMYLRQMEDANPWIAHPEASFIARTLRVEIQNAISENNDIAVALERAQALVEKQLKDKGYLK